MGKTVEKVTLKNFADIVRHSEGIINEDEIRELEV
jgi:hypothetical protein